MTSVTDFLASLLNPSGGAMSVGQALMALLIAYLGGILSSLTPCVYPMIPITVSVVGCIGNVSTRKERAWHEVAVRGLAYISGMAMIYSFLGVLAGLTGKVFGTLTNTPGWYLGLGAIMTIAALMMMDVFTLDPLMIWESFKRKLGFGAKAGHHHPTPLEQKEMTLLGSFTLGASSGFIAAPCTTPVLTSILAYIAKTQSVGLGLGLMISFSLGLGTILLLIAFFAGAMRVLPRSGKWMEKVKTASGLLLLIFAQYLIYRAGQLGGL